MSMSRAELYGESIFTSFRSLNGHVPLIEEHLLRLFRSANQYYFNERFNFKEFKEHFLTQLDLEMKIKLNPNHYFRITITADKQADLVLKEFSISDIVIDLKIAPFILKDGAKKLCLTPSPFSEFASMIKSGSYFQHFLAKQQALRNRYDDVLFERNGFVLESSMANIIFVKNGIFYTPASKGIFLGICLKVFAKFCQDNKIGFIQKEITTREISDFEMAFLANSVQLLTPVASIEDNDFDSMKSLELIKNFDDYIYNGMN